MSSVCRLRRALGAPLLAFLFALLLACLAPAPAVRAEGSASLLTSGGSRAFLEYRNDFTQNSTIRRRTRVYVYANSGETLLVASSANNQGNGRVSWIAPDGSLGTAPRNVVVQGKAIGLISNLAQETAGPLPNANGYRPHAIVVGAGQTGIWEIQFVSPDSSSTANPVVTGVGAAWTQLGIVGYVTAWDVTVRGAGGAAIPGRAFVNQLAMNVGNAGVPMSAQFHVLTRDGFRYRVDANGVQPFGFNFFANNKGFRDAGGVPLYRSVPLAGSNIQDPDGPETAADVTHKLFFNFPAADLPASATTPTGSTWLRLAAPFVPTATGFTFEGIDGTPNQAGSGLGGTFRFVSDGNANFTVGIDLNGNNSYTDAVDRTLVGTAVAGPNAILWDGFDGLGAPAPVSGSPSTVRAKITMQGGEVHFPYVDAEDNPAGIILERQTGPSSPDYTVYFDDRPLGGSAAVPPAGVVSAGGAHLWSGAFGDVRGMDTWAYVPGAVVQLANTITIRAADLQLSSKTHAPEPFVTGQPAAYTFVARNNGPDTAYAAAVLDTIPGALLSPVAGAPVTAGGATVLSSGMTGQVFHASLDLPPGSSATFQVSGVVANAAASPVVNRALVLRTDDSGDLDDQGRNGAGNNSRRDTATVVAGVTDLALDKRHTAAFTAGQPGAYTLVVRNVGSTPTTGAFTVTDTLPAGLTYTGATAPGFTIAANDPVVTFTSTGPLAPGDSAVIVMDVDVDAAAVPGVTNAAEVAGGGDGNPANDRDTDPTPVAGAPDLALNKRHTTPFVLGQTATYIFEVRNVGTVPSAGTITVIDTLPAGLAFVSGAAAPWTFSANGSIVTAQYPNALAIGAASTFTLDVSVSPGAPASVLNAATVYGGGDGNPLNDRDTDPTPIGLRPDLAIEKSHTDQFVVGRDATYLFHVSNLGPGPTYDNVVVRDTLPAGMSFVSGSGANWNFLESAGIVRATRNAPIAVGASADFELTVHVSAPALPGVTNSATIFTPGDADSTNDRDSDPTIVNAVPDLTIDKWHPGEVSVGVPFTWVFVISNVGSGSTSGTITVADTLPAGFTFVSGGGAGWSVSHANGVVTATRSATLAPADSSRFDVTVTPDGSAWPGAVNTADVSGGGDASPGNNVDTDPTAFVSTPDLLMRKQSSGAFQVGQNGTYFLDVFNWGTSPSSGAVTVTDTLPAGLSFVSGSGAGWSVSAAGAIVTATTSQTIFAGAANSQRITLTVAVAAAAQPAVTNFAEVSGGGDGEPGNNRDGDTTSVGAPDLSIDKRHTQAFTAGQNGSYTIVVHNVGAQPTSGAVTVRDTLPAGLTYVAASGGGFTPAVNGPVVTLVRAAPPIAAGDSAVIVLDVQVGAAAAPAVTNSATVSGGGDGTPGNNRDSDPTPVAALPDLAILKAHVGAFLRTGPGTYTLALTNLGGGPTAGTVTVVDTLPAGLTYASGTGTDWSVSAAGPVVTATRTTPIQPSETTTITLGVTIAANAPSPLVNAALVSGGGDTNPANDRDADTTAVDPAADLTIRKSHSGSFVAGSQGTWTITVTNVGAIPSAGTVTVRDTLPANVSFLLAQGTGWTVASPNGPLVVMQYAGAIAPNDSATFTITVLVDPSATPGVTNSATVSGGGDVNPANDRASDPTVVVVTPDLAIAKTTNSVFGVGRRVQYDFVVTNVGLVATTGAVTVTDTLPNGLVYVSATGANWTFSRNGQVVTATATGNVGVLQSRTFFITADVTPAALPGVTNTAVVANAGDPNPANDRSSVSSLFGNGPDLAMFKRHAADFTPSGAGRWTLTVRNVGAQATTDSIHVFDPLPPGVAYTGATGAGWAFWFDGSAVRATHPGPLAVGDSATFDLDVAVLPTAAAALTNTASVQTAGDVNFQNDDATDVVGVAGLSPLLVEKTASPQQVSIGDVVEYRVTVRNTVNAPIANVTVNDVLPPGFSYVAGSARWSPSYTSSVSTDPVGAPGPSLGFPLGTLQSLSTTTLTYRVVVGAGAGTGTRTNIAVAASPDGGVGGVPVVSNTAAAAVQVVGGVFGDLGIIAGKVTVDCDCAGDGRQGPEDLGVPGVRVTLEDGTSAITDAEGKYSFANLRPRLHVVRVDESTLPPGAVLRALGTRYAGAGHSKFVDLKAGEFHRADFVEGSRDERVLDAIRARRTHGEPWAAMSERDSGQVEFMPGEGFAEATTLALVVPPRVDRGVPADGRSALGIGVKVPAGRGDAPVTLEASAGRWVDFDLKDLRDLDPVAPGLQLRIDPADPNTLHHYAMLQSPAEPQDVKVRVTQGDRSDSAVVRFVPERRPLLVSGLLEGRLDLRSLENGELDGMGRDRFEDALLDASFEDQDGKFTGGGRGALYARGDVGHGVQLTARWDSEQDPEQRLFRDIRPFEGYDVLGDAAQHEWGAQSRSRLYARLDKDASFAQFGDFSTPVREAQRLGAFTRSMNGGLARLGSRVAELGGFVSEGRSRQIVDEFRGLGVSGPYALSRPTGLLNSEQVDLVTRDRNQPSRVLSSQRLTRFTDYTVEPFTGALMFRRPVPGLDADLNPVSIRVTYENESAGETFFTYGGSFALTPDPRVTFGVSAARDEDPSRPGNLASADVLLRPMPGVQLVGEFARSDSGTTFLSGDRHGQAWRGELSVTDPHLNARLFAQRAESAFDNASSLIGAGRQELGANVRLPLGGRTSVFATALRTEAIDTGGKRDGFEGGLAQVLGPFTAEGAYRWASETVTKATPPAIGPQLGDVQSVRGKLSARLPMRHTPTVFGEYEQDMDDADRKRFAAGAEVALTERTRLYARHENIASFAGPYALNDQQRLAQTVIGIASDELREGHVFSEYRARSAFPGRETEAAIGVRNAWHPEEGVRLDLSFERVTVIDNARNAPAPLSGGFERSTAISGGVELTMDPLTKATARVELRNSEAPDASGGNTSFLGTLGIARKLDRDWTALGRTTIYNGQANDLDTRTQVGVAWRPTDGNGWNGLARVENRIQQPASGDNRLVNIVSLHANTQATPRCLLMGQLAGKWTSATSDPLGPGAGSFTTTTNSQLASFRGLWDLSSRFDAGLAARGLFTDGFAQKRFGAGAELGMTVAKGLRASAGWNVFGFRDADLSSLDHTDAGPYVQFGFKFDEDLIRSASGMK